MDLMEIVNENIIYISIAFSVFIFILIILFIIMGIKLRKIEKKYDIFMGKSDNYKVEEMLIDYIEKVKETSEEQKNIKEDIENIENILKKCLQKVGIKRYNAFDDMGGDLCFAIALLDENNDGVIINGIHCRDGFYTYAKAIENGDSKYPLSAEEVQAIDRAKNKI